MAQKTPPGLQRFMAAERQVESGGDYTARNPSGAYGAYQFLPTTYANAAKAIGIAPDDWSPHSQDLVAASLMTSYYYGPAHQSWFNVAEAWNGGPGAIGQGYVAGYANEVMRIYNSRAQLTNVNLPGVIGGGIVGAGPQVAKKAASGLFPPNAIVRGLELIAGCIIMIFGLIFTFQVFGADDQAKGLISIISKSSKWVAPAFGTKLAEG